VPISSQWTRDNAALAFDEHEKGCLQVGRLGDLVVLAEDPTQVTPEALADISLEMTVVGGEIVYSQESLLQ
jgi:predicted amidohydrolase YtcJ